MKDEAKTKEQLINEAALLRRRVDELEVSESERKQAEGMLPESENKYKTWQKALLRWFTTRLHKCLSEELQPNAVTEDGRFPKTVRNCLTIYETNGEKIHVRLKH